MVLNAHQKLQFVTIKHLLVAETFSFNHWVIQGCTLEGCPGKNLYIQEEDWKFICVSCYWFWKTSSYLGMLPGLNEGLKSWHWQWDEPHFCIQKPCQKRLICPLIVILILQSYLFKLCTDNWKWWWTFFSLLLLSLSYFVKWEKSILYVLPFLSLLIRGKYRYILKRKKTFNDEVSSYSFSPESYSFSKVTFIFLLLENLSNWFFFLCILN